MNIFEDGIDCTGNVSVVKEESGAPLAISHHQVLAGKLTLCTAGHLEARCRLR